MITYAKFCSSTYVVHPRFEDFKLRTPKLILQNI
jgi:hypothetical protein